MGTSPASSSPTTEEDGLADLPGFQRIAPTGPTSPWPKEDPLPPGTTTTSSPPPDDEGDFFEDDERAAPPRPDSTARTSGSSRASIADPKAFLEITHTLVALASVLVRFVRTRRRALPEGLWLADELDQAAMGDPLARIAARHSPLEGDSSDVADGLMVLAGAAGYTVKNVLAEAEAPPMLDLTPPDDA